MFFVICYVCYSTCYLHPYISVIKLFGFCELFRFIYMTSRRQKLLCSALCRALRPLQQADSHSSSSRAANAAFQGNGFTMGNGGGAPPAPSAPLVSKNKSLPSSAALQQQQPSARAPPMSNVITSAVPTSIKAVSNASRSLLPAATPYSARPTEQYTTGAPAKDVPRAAAAVQQQRAPSKVNGTANRVLLAAGGPPSLTALRAPALLNGVNGDWEPTDPLDDGLRENNGHLRA